METVTLEHNDFLMSVHSENLCKNDVCSIHNLTNHILRSAEQDWDFRRGIMVRRCRHLFLHPDPDDHKVRRNPDKYKCLAPMNDDKPCCGCCKDSFSDIL